MADDITARLGLDTSPFARALRGVNGTVAAAGKSINQAFTGALGGFIGGAAIVAGTKRLMDYVSRLGDTAEALEVTTKFLQEFNYATAQNGVDEEKSIRALSKLTLTLGEAAEGSDKARKSFSDLGVKFTNADGSLKTTEQLLKDVADAFAKSVDPTKSARLAVELFGREGINMIPTLKAGSSGLAEFAKQGQKSIISEDNISAIKALGDAITGIGKGGIGIAGNVFGSMLRGLHQLGAYVGVRAAGLTPGQALDYVDAMYRKVADGGTKIFPKQSEAEIKAVEKIKETYAKLRDSIKENDASILEGSKKIKALQDIYDQKRKELLLEKDRVKTVEKLNELEKARNDLLKEQKSLAEKLADFNARGAEAQKTLAERKTDLATAKTDPSKFSLQDLATSPIRFRGRLERERIGARAVVQLENRADLLKSAGYGDQAQLLRNRANFIRSQLTNVVEADRFPFKSLEENTKSAADALKELDRKASQEGLITIGPNR